MPDAKLLTFPAQAALDDKEATIRLLLQDGWQLQAVTHQDEYVFIKH